MENHSGSVTVAGLEAYLHRQYAGWASEQGLFMKLVEEMGEVAEVLNRRAGRKSNDQALLSQELGKELADVMHYVIAIAAVNELDFNQMILEKDKEASVKYHHDMDLETFLSTCSQEVRV